MLIRNTYSKEQQDAVVKRVLKYAGATMETRKGGPYITKREAIMLADFIKSLLEKPESE